MTPKQREYARLRGEGLGQQQAAIVAGYARSSAKVIASRMERMPEIAEAIEKARGAAQNGAGATVEYETAADYLLAVTKGLAVPDPVRVQAAKAILPYERAKTRAPVKSATPRQIQERDALTSEQELLARWAERAAAVRARLARERAKRP